MSDPSGPERQIERLQAENRKMALLMETAHILSTERNLDLLIGLIVERTTEIMNADRSSVFLLDRAHNELYSFVAQGLDSQELRFPATMGLSGHVATTGETLNIADAYQDSRFNREVDRRTGYRTKSVLCMPLRNKRGEMLGVIQALNKKDANGEAVPFPKEDESFLENLGSQAAIFIENAHLYKELDGVFEAFISTAAKSIEDRDPCTSGHSRRVTAYALNLARVVHAVKEGPFAGVQYTRAKLRRLRYAGMMHDFGKIGVREHILGKENKLNAAQIAALRERLLRRKEEILREAYARAARGREANPDAFVSAATEAQVRQIAEGIALAEKLNTPGFVTDEQIAKLGALKSQGYVTDIEHENLSVRKGNLTRGEWDDMQSHVLKTYQILSKMPWPKELDELPQIAGQHHEKLDGSGYPWGLRGGQVSLDARILAVADMYDALTATDRPYKRAIPHDKARAIIEDEVKLGKLDGELVRLFFDTDACHLTESSASTTVLLKAEVEAARRSAARRPLT